MKVKPEGILKPGMMPLLKMDKMHGEERSDIWQTSCPQGHLVDEEDCTISNPCPCLQI